MAKLRFPTGGDNVFVKCRETDSTLRIEPCTVGGELLLAISIGEAEDVVDKGNESGFKYRGGKHVTVSAEVLSVLIDYLRISESVDDYEEFDYE